MGIAAPNPREHDIELARRAATGDRLAQRDLFHAQRGAVHRTLFRILGSNRELEDLIQDAFLEIFRSLGSFRGDSSLTSWCRTIATRIAYLAISRRRPPAVALELVEEAIPGGGDAERTLHMRNVVRRLYAALDRIDPKQRIAFALFVVEGLPVREVAQLTESSTVAVKTRVWRARRDLMKRAAKDPVLASYVSELSEAERGGAADE